MLLYCGADARGGGVLRARAHDGELRAARALQAEHVRARAPPLPV